MALLAIVSYEAGVRGPQFDEQGEVVPVGTPGDIVTTNGEVTLLANDRTQVVGAGAATPTTGATFPRGRSPFPT